MFKIIRKGDIVLFFLLLAMGIALSVPGFASGVSNASAGEDSRYLVEINVDGRTYGEYDLSKDAELLVIQKKDEIYIEALGSENNSLNWIDVDADSSQLNDVDHFNKVVIKDGKVQMEDASCHNHVCIRQGKIKRNNQSIVCLPNRVVVRIVAGNNQGLDNEEGQSEGGDVDVVTG